MTSHGKFAVSHNVVDDMAVERRLAGDLTIKLTIAERRVCVRRLHALGMNDKPIAKRLGISDRTVLRIRKLLGLAANERQLPMPDHGQLPRYRRGCRCPRCRRANTEHAAAYARRLRGVA